MWREARHSVVYVVNYELKEWLRGAFIVEAGLRL
jgi:hypothetical protein